MCGIAGWVDYDSRAREASATAAKMSPAVRTLAANGPTTTPVWYTAA